MALLGRRSFPTPIVKPLAPFIITAGIVLYTVNKIENVARSIPPFDTDPRNPRALLNKKLKEQHH
ncbi:8866_t:CDS:2 [Funneliformis geosporum]|uniref:5513_t:CDS:1 n=1 Tax=Funneliformis geosporum TaxID=1117311 RepID=A0A9W4WKM3_9GLOM|nr:5513_t:CDS:2 [Funneliformis geosporum]CAI2169207.1 8866_t:CDS:2 [Funneliformis geosporum]